MNKTTPRSMITRLGWGVSFLVLLFLAIHVIPRVLGARESIHVTGRSSDVEAPSEQQSASFAPAAPAGNSTLTGTLGTAPAGGATGSLTTRITRPGTPTATCAGVTWPGNIGNPSYIYNVHYVTNSTASPLCTAITFTMLTQGTPVGNMQLSAFRAPFVAADITNAARYLGDAGQSSNEPGVRRTFQLTVPAHTTIALVVFNTELLPAGFGGTYRIELSENPTPTPTPAPTPTPFCCLVCVPGQEMFNDVPAGSPFCQFIEELVRRGITSGCTPTQYCPSASVTRAQMAIFLLKALEGSGYTPPPCVPGQPRMFTDVPASSPFCPWIEELVRRGITSGCGGGNYCPSAPVTRAQMAIFLLRTLEGSGYTPPPCVPGQPRMFTDVPASSPFCPWIEELVRRGITSGCGGGNYCPGTSVNRAQMAAFLVRTF